VSRFLIDEMFSATTAQLLRDTYHYDAVHVSEVGLQAVEDALVAATVRAENRAVVTENVADFAAERDLVLLFVLKRNLPAGGARALTTDADSACAGGSPLLLAMPREHRRRPGRAGSRMAVDSRLG